MKKAKWLKLLRNLDVSAACAALAVLVLNTLAAMVMRLVTEQPPIWPREVQVFCQVWLSFLGAGAALRYGMAAATGTFANLLPEKGRRLLAYAVDVLAVFILAFLLVQFGNYVSWFFGRLHVSSASLGIPYKLIYGISPYACALMIVSYLLNRYLPGSVREPDAGAAGREGEVTAQ